MRTARRGPLKRLWGFLWGHQHLRKPKKVKELEDLKLLSKIKEYENNSRNEDVRAKKIDLEERGLEVKELELEAKKAKARLNKAEYDDERSQLYEDIEDDNEPESEEDGEENLLEGVIKDVFSGKFNRRSKGKPDPNREKDQLDTVSITEVIGPPEDRKA